MSQVTVRPIESRKRKLKLTSGQWSKKPRSGFKKSFLARPLRTVERKEVVTYVNASVNQQTPSYIVSLVNGVSQGTDTTNRIGRKVTHNYIEIKALITAFTGVSDAGFWSLVLDRQGDGSTPAFTDIYDTSTVTVGGLAPRNTLVNQDRFLILASEDYRTTGTTIDVPYYMKRFVDLRNVQGNDRTMNFNSTGAAAADINHGAIWFVCASASALSASPTSVKCGLKYRFTDV